MKLMFNAITGFKLEIDIVQLEDELYHSLMESYKRGNKTKFAVTKYKYKENIKFLKSLGIHLNESRLKMKLKLGGIEI